MAKSLMAVALAGLAFYICGSVLLRGITPWVAVTIYWGLVSIYWVMRAFER